MCMYVRVFVCTSVCVYEVLHITRTALVDDNIDINRYQLALSCYEHQCAHKIKLAFFEKYNKRLLLIKHKQLSSFN